MWIHLLISISFFLIMPFLVLAQSDGSAIPPETPISTLAPTSAVAAPVQAQTVPARTTISTPISSPVPTSSPQSTPTPTTLITPTTTPRPTPAPSDPPDSGLLYWIIAGVGSIFAMGGFAIYRGKVKRINGDDDKCRGIKDLLEKKKKELEEFVKKWPEEKLKSMAQNKVLGELKKDESAKVIIETAESLKAKHDKLKKTIEMLQKQYNLCTLEFPSEGRQVYRGKVVENSLHDKKILEDVKITKTYPVEDWTLHDILIGGEKIDKLGAYIADGPWYIHLWQEGKDDVIVVFKDKNFKIKYSDKSTWKEAIEYGKSKGIPVGQLDFAIN